MEEISEVATLKLDVANEELVYCFVNTRYKSLPKQKIIAHLEKEVGPSRMTDEILFIEKIPRTHTQKIKYKELSDLAKREILRVQSL